jgi:hypothetical protein
MKKIIILTIFLAACAAPVAENTDSIKMVEREAPTEKYIGMSEDAAVMLADMEGYVPRILIRDGKWASQLGEGLHGMRINFNIEKGIVINAALD